MTINWWHALTLLLILISFAFFIYVMTYIGTLLGIILYIISLPH